MSPLVIGPPQTSNASPSPSGQVFSGTIATVSRSDVPSIPSNVQNKFHSTEMCSETIAALDKEDLIKIAELFEPDLLPKLSLE
jgi:hypothetical protein